MEMPTLGDFEARTLYAVALDRGHAYGVSIHDTIEQRTGDDVAMGALYATLDRLEKKGYLRSWWSEPTSERGGRRKRLFELTGLGERALQQYDERFRSMSAGWRAAFEGG
jgi:DNA-binding PadR family transcriptional regulator